MEKKQTFTSHLCFRGAKIFEKYGFLEGLYNMEIKPEWAASERVPLHSIKFQSNTELIVSLEGKTQQHCYSSAPGCLSELMIVYKPFYLANFEAYLYNVIQYIKCNYGSIPLRKIFHEWKNGVLIGVCAVTHNSEIPTFYHAIEFESCTIETTGLFINDTLYIPLEPGDTINIKKVVLEINITV